MEGYVSVLVLFVIDGRRREGGRTW